MENYNVVNKGIITLGNKVMVSDPCYGLNTWCQGVVENVLPGEYVCKVGFSDEGDWGNRVADIEVVHTSYVGKFLEYFAEDFEVGVDSGQAGIFDYEYYKQHHTDRSEAEHVDDEWYDRAFTCTYVKEKNPNYEKFVYDYDNEDWYEKWEAYEKDWKRSLPYLSHLDGNTIDGLGLVSSSGFGDGGYTCWTARNDKGEVVSIRVEFISEYDEEEDEEIEGGITNA